MKRWINNYLYVVLMLSEGTEHDKPQQIIQDVHALVGETGQDVCTHCMLLCRFILYCVEIP